MRFSRVISMMILCAACLAAEPPEQDAAEWARRAIEAMDQHQLVEAEKDLRESLRILPKQPTRLYNLACVLAAQRKDEAALGTLEKAADAGFTDFSHLMSNQTLARLQDEPRFVAILKRRDQVVRHAGEAGLAALRTQLGDGYLYDLDEQRKWLFAVAIDRPALEQLKQELVTLQRFEAQQLFSHPPDEFIRIIVPNPADFRRLSSKLAHVGGSYDDTTRRLLVEHLGQFMSHEFTHALHAADQHALRQEHPVWLSEGLASLFEAAILDEPKVTIDDNFRLPYVKTAARNGVLLPLDKLLQLSRSDFNARPNQTYGQASYLLRYLMEKGELKSFYDAYTAGYGDDPTGLAALRKTTGMSLDELHTDWTKWLLARPDPPDPARPGAPVLGVALNEAASGLRITRIAPTGPASGKLLAGDLLLDFDGKVLHDRPSLERCLNAGEAGRSVRLRVRRGDSDIDLELTLGRR